MMGRRKLAVFGKNAIACLLLNSISAGTLYARQIAQAGNKIAVIRGTVQSSNGASLYGILVRAKPAGKNFSTYVYTGDNGAYDFPALPIGEYQLSVGTRQQQTVQLGTAGVTQDFTAELGPEFLNQTTGPSWWKLVPASAGEKKRVLQFCNTCHATSRLFLRAPASPTAWSRIVERMILNTTSSAPPPPSANASAADLEYGQKSSPENIKAISETLTKYVTPEFIAVNAAKAMVRPTGESARAVFTEWNMPTGPKIPGNKRGVGDAWADKNGIIWYTTATTLGMGRLEPHTGEMQEWPYHAPKPVGGIHDMRPDERGDLWLTAPWDLNQIIKFDVRSHQYVPWNVPKEVGDYPHTGDLDHSGNFWFTLSYGEDSGVAKVDPRTGKVSKYPLPSKSAFCYGIVVDQKDNVWFTEFDANKIGKLEARTRKLTEYTIPTPDAKPRRIRVDSKGRLWFTASGFNAQLSMLDPKTGKFSEYELGIPNAIPYYITIDKFDKILFSADEGNLLMKFDPATKKFTSFLLPVPDTYPRNGEVDYSTDPYGLIYASSNFPTIGRMIVRRASR
jgi:streptogramin lyase